MGTWQITDESRKLLPGELQEAAGKLTLAADGTFVAVELPVSAMRWSTPSDPVPAYERPTLLTASGDWKLHQTGVIAADMVYLSYVSGEFPDGFSYALSVHPVFRDYRLVDYWGDPDVVPGIFYSRTEAAGLPRRDS
jgi:hypothetical protein